MNHDPWKYYSRPGNNLTNRDSSPHRAQHFTIVANFWVARGNPLKLALWYARCWLVGSDLHSCQQAGAQALCSRTPLSIIFVRGQDTCIPTIRPL